MTTILEFAALRELFSSFNNSEQEFKEALLLLRKIQAYSFEQVCCLFHQSDILLFLKSCLHYETSRRLQSLSIEYLAVLLLRIYLILHQKPQGVNFDGYASSESYSDLQRLKEDITDFVFEQLKFIFNIIVDESKLIVEPNEQTELSIAAEKLVAVILQTYHGATLYVQEHVDSVLGTNEFNQTHLTLSHQLLLPHYSAIRHALHPIIDLIITTLFESSKGSTRHLHHLLYLHDRAMRSLSYLSNGHTLDYLHDWMLFIQTASQEGSKLESFIVNFTVLLQLYDLSDPEKLRYKPLFLEEDDQSKSKDLTIHSRAHSDASIVLQDWIHSWIETSLLQIIKTSIHPVEKLQAVKTAMQLIMNQVPFSSSSQLLASLFQQIISVFDEYELLNDEYDIAHLVTEEELVVFLVEILSFLPQSFQIRFSDDTCCWPLYQAIDRIGRYYEREFQSNQFDQTITIRSTRVVTRWFIVVLQLLTMDGDYRLVGGIHEQKARSNSDVTSLLKLICHQLNRSGFPISPSSLPTNFSFVFYSTLIQCYGSFITKLQELIRFVPMAVRTRLFPNLQQETMKGKEEMGNHSSIIDLLDTHNPINEHFPFDEMSVRVAKLRNLVVATLVEVDSSDTIILSPFQKFQYFRSFPSIQSLTEYLKTALLSKGLSPSSAEMLVVCDEVVARMWENDLLSLIEINMALYDDFLAIFASFSSAVMLTNATIDHGSQSLLLEAINQLSNFYLFPLQSQYKSYSPQELSSFWQYFFLHHPAYQNEYVTHSSEFLGLLTKIVDHRLFVDNKVASASTFPLEDFIEEKESSSVMTDAQHALKYRLFEVLVIFIIPAVQERVLNSELSERDEQSLQQLITHVISYVKQTIFYYSDHVDRWSLFKQLRSFSTQGIFGGGGIQSTPQSVSSMHEMRGLAQFNYFANDVDHSSFHIQPLHVVVDSLRLIFQYFHQPTQLPLQPQGAFFQSLLEAIFQQVIIPVENSFIFTEISLFLEQHPAIQQYLDQSKHQAQSDLNYSLDEFVEEDEDTNHLATAERLSLLHRLLPAKEMFYSTIQLYKSYFKNRLVFLLDQEDRHNGVVEAETDLLSAENHPQSSTMTLLQSADLKLLCRTSMELKAIEDMIAEYFSCYRQIKLQSERFCLFREVLEQHQILGLLVNYINILFFQNKEFFLHTTSQQQPIIEGGPRRKSRNNSLLLDFNPITEDDSPKVQTDSLLLAVENIQHLVAQEEQGGDNRVFHLPLSSHMSEYLNRHYLPFHLNCGLFSRSVNEIKKQSRWGYFYSDHFLTVNDVISSFLPPVSLPLSLSGAVNQEIASSRLIEKRKEMEVFDLIKEVLFDEDELIYSQLSGSGDILTVQMAITSFNPVAKRLKGRVRVINHSAFKIPFFRLSLLLQANTLLVNPNQPASAVHSATSFHLFPPEHLHIHKENMGICASLQSGELLSAEYFPSNAVIEREFNITWHFFAPFEIITRLEYTELSRNQDIYSNFPTSESQVGVANSQVPATPSANRKQDFQRLVPCYLETNQGIDYQIYHNQYDLPASQQRNYLKYNAVIDMPPFHISIVYLLRAYANHQFRALCYWRLQQLHPSVFSRHRDMEIALFPVHRLLEELPREVIPKLQTLHGLEKVRAVHDFTLQWPFFQEQFLRLTDRYSHSCTIAVPVDVNDLPPTHHHLLMQTTFLRFFTNLQEELLRQPFNAVSSELGAIGLDCISLHPQQGALGWTLQTVWNDDIAVLVQFHPKRYQLQSVHSASNISVFDDDDDDDDNNNNNNDDEKDRLNEEMFARLQIRCGESHILQAVLIDLAAFIHVLSGGFFTLVAEQQ